MENLSEFRIIEKYNHSACLIGGLCHSPLGDMLPVLASLIDQGIYGIEWDHSN